MPNDISLSGKKMRKKTNKRLKLFEPVEREGREEPSIHTPINGGTLKKWEKCFHE